MGLLDCDEIDAFFAAPGKRCPATFLWPDKAARKNERRARQAIEVDGALSSVEMEIVIRMHEPGFLVVVLLAPMCITRLCLGSAHYDAKRRIIVEQGHLHPWHANRPKGLRIPDKLAEYELLPDTIVDRDAAFAWFLTRHRIESSAPGWPDSEDMF